MKYIVKRQTINGWEVAFHDIDQNDKQTITLFDTKEAAEKEIQSYLEEVKQAVSDGNMDDCETRYDLQIVALECPMCGAGVDECLEGGWPIRPGVYDGEPVVCRECASVPQGATGEPIHEPRS